MHKRIVLNIVSRMFFLNSVAMLVPLALAAFDDLHSREVLAFSAAILLGMFVSTIILITDKVKKEDYQKINSKDGLAVVALSWISISLLGALPFYLSGVVPTYTDAFFEVMSGFTTTGASIFTDVEVLPRAILLWRALTHWLGGLGIVVLYVVLLPVVGQGSFQLYKGEAAGLAMDRMEPSLKGTYRILWIIYLLITIITTVLFFLSGMPLFDSICHSFASVSTGGFSNKNTSLVNYNSFVQWSAIIGMVLGGTNFILHYQALKGNLRIFTKNEEFKFYIGSLFWVSAFFAAILWMGNHSVRPITDAVFQVVTIMTCTGFASADFDQWPHILRFLLLMLMFIGGCMGSTSGGVKCYRMLLTVKVIFNNIIRNIFPNAVLPVKFNSRPIGDSLIMAILSYVIVYASLLLLGTVVLLEIEGCDIITAFSAVSACLSNCGPGLAKVGPMVNYAWMSDSSKWLLSFIMLCGRLEIYAVLILFVPSTWKK